MPDLNSRGGRIDGRGLMYLIDDTVIGQVKVGEPDVWQVCTRPVDSPWWTPVSEHGASMIAARAGHWIGFFAGGGIFGPGGWDSRMGLAGDMQAGRGVAAADGTIGVVLDYQAGLGLRLWAPDGSVVDLPAARPAAAGVCIVDRQRAVWLDLGTGQIEVCGGLPACHVIPGPFSWPTALYLGGEWWIAYHSTDAMGVVLHPFADPTSGYKVSRPPAYYLAAVALDGTRAKLAWSLTPDDLTGRERVIDVAHDPRVALAPLPTLPTPLPTPVPGPPAPAPVPPPNTKPIPPPAPPAPEDHMLPPIGDNEIIELSQRWIQRYQVVGRYDAQTPAENIRDQAYWIVVYARAREKGTDHEHAMQAMENGMADEAGQPHPFL